MKFTLSARRVSPAVGFLATAIIVLTALGSTGCGFAGKPNSFGNGGTPGGADTSGNGGAPAAAATTLAASSTALSFGDVTVGASTAQLVTLTNMGNTNVSISDVSATGSGFSASGGARMILAPGQAITVSVNFNPTAAGAMSGGLSIASTASSSPIQIGLSGNGIPQSQHTVRLNWQAAPSAVIGYFVYRAVGGSGSSRLNSFAESNTTYADNTVVGGQTYSYTVTSVDSNNVESAQSSPITVTIPAQ